MSILVSRGCSFLLSLHIIVTTSTDDSVEFRIWVCSFSYKANLSAQFHLAGLKFNYYQLNKVSNWFLKRDPGHVNFAILAHRSVSVSACHSLVTLPGVVQAKPIPVNVLKKKILKHFLKFFPAVFPVVCAFISLCR